MTSLDTEHSADGEDLLYSPCGQDGTIYGCQELVLVELATRFAEWKEGREEAGEEAPAALPPQAAVDAVQHWMTRQA